MSSAFESVHRGDMEALQKHLATGHPVNAVNPEGDGLLLLAVSSKVLGSVQMLLDAGACVDQANLVGWTPLHEATRLGELQTLQVLLQAGASPHVVDPDLYTPLHIAALNGHTACLQSLVQAGGDPFQTTQRRETPLSLARTFISLNTDCVLFLRGLQQRKVLQRISVTPLCGPKPRRL